MDATRDEWDNLNESQRNCLMWPDLLVWQKELDVEIQRNESNDTLGLITVTVQVQDKDTKQWYNVTKRIKENHPAHGHVQPYKWIFKVDDITTTDCPSDKFSELIRNGKKKVCLSQNGPVDPLAQFKKKWGAAKTVTVKEPDFKGKCRLVHFYSKDDSGNTKDRILVWEAKCGIETILHRGDELLEVNGLAVEGKKLAQIYKLILNETQNGDVKFKIKAVEISCVEETAHDTVPLESESYLNSPDASSEKAQLNADSLGGPKSPPGSKKKMKRRSLRRSLSSSKTVPEEEANDTPTPPTPSALNEAYRNSPTTPRKSFLCSECIAKGETKIPGDRDSWPIYKIEPGCRAEICMLLDLEERSNMPLLAALDDFTSTEADSMRQKCRQNGCSMAKNALDKWGTSKRKHNVGALKEILENKLERVDVLEVIEKWEKLHVCHGCGVKLSQS